jgi:hypothetical protein
MPQRTQSTAQLLGYPDDARLLIINADDFGMCHAENVATMEGLERGAFCSATVMVPCPWFDDAAAYARRHPQADIGVHITHTSEWDIYKWGPLCSRTDVPSLVDANGHFYRDLASFYAHAQIGEAERETRAQIDRALAAGIDVTHLDSHMGTVQLDADYHEIYVRLAAAYRLPIRMMSRSALRDLGMKQIVELADRLGVLAPDYLWIGGPPTPKVTEAYWSEMLRHLKPGVTELYVHAAVDTPELRAIYDLWPQRPADFAFFNAPATQQLLDQLGIIRIGYRTLRHLQRQASPC